VGGWVFKLRLYVYIEGCDVYTGSDGLFKDIYPFSDVPRVVVADSVLMENLAKIYMTDSTLREGQQGWRPFTVSECERVYELLADIGDGGGVASTEIFLYTEKDREVASRLRSYGYEHPKPTPWIRATLSDLQLVIDQGFDEAVVLMSISDYHIKFKLGLTRDIALGKYLEVAERAMSSGVVVKASLEDVTRADVDNVVIPFIQSLIKIAEKHGLPVKVKLPDTLGVGLPFPYMPPPRGIPALVEKIRRQTGIPQEHLEFHGHNDLGLALANHLAAWFHGAASANCTLLGIGERAGNCPLEVLAVHYAGIKGSKGLNLKALPRVREVFEEMGYKIPAHHPVVGRNAFTQKSGIHVDGLLKNPEVYLPFNPETVLGTPFNIAVTSYSGRAAVLYWLKTKIGLDSLGKDDPRVLAVYNEITRIFEKEGRSEPLTDCEMLELAEKHFRGVIPSEARLRLGCVEKGSKHASS
jgi:isopropylmalate/homocitrate/citramalate synthase